MLEPFVYGVLVPALLAGAAWGVTWRVWSRDRSSFAGGAWCGGIAFALAYCAGFLGLMGKPVIPPNIVEDWLPIACVPLAIWSVLESSVLKRTSIRLPIHWFFAAILLWLLLGPKRQYAWKGAELWLWHAGLLASVAGLWAGLEALAQRRQGITMPLTLWIWAVGIVGAQAMTGSIKLAQFAGILAATLGAATVAALVKPTFTLARGALSVLVPLTSGLLICGYFYSDLPASCAILLTLAPMALWLGETKYVVALKPWKATAARMAMIGLPVIIALSIAAAPFIFPEKAKAKPASSGEEDWYK